MSDLTSQNKATTECISRYERGLTLLPLGIATIATFAFMKTAVLDWSVPTERPARIPRLACTTFRDSLTRSHALPALPDGLQVWLGHFKPKRATEAWATVDELSVGEGPFKGYIILVVTYIVDALLIQITFPRWNKWPRKAGPLPFFDDVRDGRVVPIWPNVNAALWPPPRHVTSQSVQSFRERFRKVLMPTFLS
jgi:hypothetical protein